MAIREIRVRIDGLPRPGGTGKTALIVGKNSRKGCWWHQWTRADGNFQLRCRVRSRIKFLLGDYARGLVMKKVDEHRPRSSPACVDVASVACCDTPRASSGKVPV